MRIRLLRRLPRESFLMIRMRSAAITGKGTTEEAAVIMEKDMRAAATMETESAAVITGKNKSSL